MVTFMKYCLENRDYFTKFLFFEHKNILLITLIKTIIKYYIALRGEIKQSTKFQLSMYLYSKYSFNIKFYR